jgi:hypothetical protein
MAESKSPFSKIQSLAGWSDFTDPLALPFIKKINILDKWLSTILQINQISQYFNSSNDLDDYPEFSDK